MALLEHAPGGRAGCVGAAPPGLRLPRGPRRSSRRRPARRRPGRCSCRSRGPRAGTPMPAARRRCGPATATVTAAPARTASPAWAGPPRHATGRSPDAVQDEPRRGRPGRCDEALREHEHADVPRAWLRTRTRAPRRVPGTGTARHTRSTSSQRSSDGDLDLHPCGQLDPGQVGIVHAGQADLARPARECGRPAARWRPTAPAVSRRPCPSSLRRPRPDGGSAAGRRATPTGARCTTTRGWRSPAPLPGAARGRAAAGRSARARSGPSRAPAG